MKCSIVLPRTLPFISIVLGRWVRTITEGESSFAHAHMDESASYRYRYRYRRECLNSLKSKTNIVNCFVRDGPAWSQALLLWHTSWDVFSSAVYFLPRDFQTKKNRFFTSLFKIFGFLVTQSNIVYKILIWDFLSEILYFKVRNKSFLTPLEMIFL